MKTSAMLFLWTIAITLIEILAKVDAENIATYCVFTGFIVLALEKIEDAIKNLKK